MDISQQLADFTAYAQLLANEQGGNLTLDDAYEQWKSIDPQELATLRDRLRSYDAGERGRPASESMADLRNRLLAKYGK